MNGKLVIDDWTTHPLKTDTGVVNVTAGSWNAIRMEYRKPGCTRSSVAVAQHRDGRQDHHFERVVARSLRRQNSRQPCGGMKD